MAVKSINDSIGPDGLVPTLLVFGAMPRLGLPNNLPNSSTFNRARALRHVSDALSRRNGPDVSDIHKTPIKSHVLVHWPKKGKWDGPFALLNLKGEDTIVLLPSPSGPTKFRTTVVKPFIVDKSRYAEAATSATHANCMAISDDDKLHLSFVAYVDDLEKFDIFDDDATSWKTIVQQSDDHATIASSRAKEFNSLVDRGVLVLVPESDAKGYRIFNSSFVDTVKNGGTPSALPKSRLVIMAFNNKNHGLLTGAPTVQRSSPYLLLAVSGTSADIVIILRDITQAYPQSKTSMVRSIFV